MQDKVAIITGASRGIGFEISKDFLKNGFNISICSRNNKDLISAKKRLEKFNKKKKKILIKKVDVSKKADVKKFISFTYKNYKKIDVLVNNAGVYGPMGRIDKINVDKWKSALDTNLLGSFYLIYYALPILKKNKRSKVIQLSGGGATKPTPYINCYGASKAGVVRFVESISIELKKFKIDINSVAPGAINTSMLNDVIKSGPNVVGKKIYENALKQKKDGGASVKNCLELISFLASKKSNGITGRLISAIWDNWKELPKIKKKLINKDVYTLRRMIGKHVGLNKLDL